MSNWRFWVADPREVQRGAQRRPVGGSHLRGVVFRETDTLGQRAWLVGAGPGLARSKSVYLFRILLQGKHQPLLEYSHWGLLAPLWVNDYYLYIALEMMSEALLEASWRALVDKWA
jgi:hypothetical protein